MKAIFPDSKLLQPIPTPNVHPNISGNTNNSATTSQEVAPAQNILNTQNSNPAITAPNDTKGVSNITFYFIACIIIIIIIITYRKLKRK